MMEKSNTLTRESVQELLDRIRVELTDAVTVGGPVDPQRQAPSITAAELDQLEKYIAELDNEPTKAAAKKADAEVAKEEKEAKK